MSELDLELGEDNGSSGVGKRLQNDQQVYVVALLSLFLWIPVGTMMAIFSLIRANEELDDYRANPIVYLHESYLKIKKGRNLAIAALILQLISIPAFIVFVILAS